MVKHWTNDDYENALDEDFRIGAQWSKTQINLMEGDYKMSKVRREKLTQGLGEEEIKHMLMSHAEACMALADKLGEGGDPLNGHEQQLIRSAMLPAIKESMEIMQSAYVTGSTEWLEREAARLDDLLSIPRR